MKLDSNKALFLLSCLTLSLLVNTSANAQQEPSAPSLHWSTTDGNQYLETNGSDLHLKPRTEKIGPGVVNATAKLNLPDTQKWQVSFDIRFGILRDQASNFHLSRGGHDIGWVGADGFNKQMGVFVGKDTEVFATATDTEWHHLSYISNGNILIVQLDNKQVGTGAAQNIPDSLVLGNGQDMSVPCHQEGVWVRNVSVQNETKPAPLKQTTPIAVGQHDVTASSPKQIQLVTPEVTNPVFSPVSHEPTVVDVQENDKALFCVLGDTVHLAGTTSGQHRLSRRSLEINGQPYTDHPANPNEDGYNFDWKPRTLGTYQLAVNFFLQKPIAILEVRSITVNVIPKAPLAIQKFSNPVPASCPVAVQSVDTTTFHPARIEFFLNGASVGTAQREPFQVTLPVSKQLPGSYTVSYQAYDAQGSRLNGETETISVPLRVRSITPSSVTLAKAKDATSFTSDMVTGLKVVKVTYFVGDQPVASTTVPPYDTTADLSSFKSDTYPLRADVQIEDGETFCNPPATLSLTNQPDDARLAKLAKEEADRQGRLAKENADRQASLQKAEADRQALVAKQVADAMTHKVEAENLAKLNEERYEKDVADNTVIAVRSNQISIALDGNLTKIGDSYWLTLKITNHTNRVIGPIDPDMHFDDFSSSILLPYDDTIPNPFDEYGFPTKILSDRYHDLVVPANGTKNISYFASNLTASEKARKPTRVGFMGTLRNISLPVNP